MPTLPTLPLVAANEVEINRTWEELGTPAQFLAWLIQHMAVDPKKLGQFNEIIFGSSAPVGLDKGKLFIKTTNPPAIGIPVGETYQYIYTYPVNVPLPWAGAADEVPVYLTKMGAADLLPYGITIPEDSDKFYVMLQV